MQSPRGATRRDDGRVLRMGILGMGVSGAHIARAMKAMPNIELVAAADTRPAGLAAFEKRYGGRTYASAEEICADPDVDALWIATPNQYHCEHAVIAAEHGKHLIIEKPIAITMDEATRMLEAVERSGVSMVCGHTQSYTPRARATLAILRSGALGAVRALHVWAFTDWMLRARAPVDLDPALGGGVPFRQAPHQVDTLRVLGGGMVRSVRGMVGQWMPERPIPGYYTAYLEFEDGTPATLMHNGYGYLNASELVDWGTDSFRGSPESRSAIRKQLLAGTWDEAQDKEEEYLGGAQEAAQARRGPEEGPWIPDDLGILVVSCERGDIRYSPHGIYVYDGEGKREVPVEGRHMAGNAELTELYDAVVLGKPLSHSGPWGAATLEVCLAIMESARERKEIYLQHQVPTPAHYA